MMADYEKRVAALDKAAEVSMARFGELSKYDNDSVDVEGMIGAMDAYTTALVAAHLASRDLQRYLDARFDDGTLTEDQEKMRLIAEDRVFGNANIIDMMTKKRVMIIKVNE